MKKIALITGLSAFSAFSQPTFDNTKTGERLKHQTEITTDTTSKNAKTDTIYLENTITYPDTLEQGKTGVFKVQAKGLNSPYFSFDGKILPLYKDNDSTFSGIIGTNPNQKTGEILAIFKDAGKRLSDTVKIFIKRVKFGSQNITTSKSVSSLTATVDENAKIGAALKTKSDTAYFEQSPFQVPVKGNYKSPYGVKRIENGVYKNSFHKGIDISAPLGTEIKPVNIGKVLVAEQFRLNGGTVIIDHGHGMTSVYLHMSKIHVKKGQKVSLKDIIGEVGSTGHSTGPHLHFGIYVNGTPVEPLQFIKLKESQQKIIQKTAVKLIKKLAIK